MEMTSPTDTPAAKGGAVMTTAIATPHPDLPAETLNRLVRVFADSDPAPVSVGLDGHAFGVVVDGVAVDEIVIRERDLHFIHSLDATRFGSHDECEICTRGLS